MLHTNNSICLHDTCCVYCGSSAASIPAHPRSPQSNQTLHFTRTLPPPGFISPDSAEVEHNMSSRVQQQQQAGGGQALEEGNNISSIGAATVNNTRHNHRREVVWYDTPGSRGSNHLTLRGRGGRRYRHVGTGRHNADFLIFSLAFAVVVSCGV